MLCLKSCALHCDCSAAVGAAGCSEPDKQQPSAVQLEEEALARIQAAVAERYTAAIAGPEVQVRRAYDGARCRRLMAWRLSATVSVGMAHALPG